MTSRISTSTTVIVRTTARTPLTKNGTATATMIHPCGAYRVTGAHRSDGSNTPATLTITTGGGRSGA